jgi:cytochrome c oxidase subunit 1/cytochrome c oxidase subunit I+III
VIGGVSGFMTASVPADWQLTDTYFVVAHLHYVLIGINLFPVVGAIYFWFPKFTGRMLGERLGRVNFWTMFVGFNIAFLPMHWLGLLGMPRRVYTYAAQMGWDTTNLVISAGSFLFAAGVLLLPLNVLISLRRGRPAGDNPWGAPTLEWATSSPPPDYNFAVIPTVASRHPLWEEALDHPGGRSVLHRGMALDQGREALAVSPLDSDPQLVLKMPEDTPVPFLVAVAVSMLFIGLLLHAWWLAAVAAAGALAALLAWLWPSRALGQTAGAPR